MAVRKPSRNDTQPYMHKITKAMAERIAAAEKDGTGFIIFAGRETTEYRLQSGGVEVHTNK